MTKLSSLNPRYILKTWYIFQMSVSEINQLIDFLRKNPRINLEINKPQITGLENNNLALIISQVEECVKLIISAGIEKSRVISGKFAESNLPMYRVVHSN